MLRNINRRRLHEKRTEDARRTKGKDQKSK